MTPQPHKISGQLRPYVDHSEAEEFDQLAAELGEQVPLPRPAFRAELRKHLSEQVGRAAVLWRPRNLRLAIGGYLASGLLLIAAAAVSV